MLNETKEKYQGLPYVADAYELRDVSENGERDWSNRILMPEKNLNNKWVLIEAIAYLRSFNGLKALVYCAKYHNEKKELCRGYFYDAASFSQYGEKMVIGNQYYLTLKPTRYSLFITNKIINGQAIKKQETATQTQNIIQADEPIVEQNDIPKLETIVVKELSSKDKIRMLEEENKKLEETLKGGTKVVRPIENKNSI